MSVKMIASWGSSGGGKSTLAVALAAKLAKHNKNVVIIAADTKTPALPLFLPRMDFSPTNSIGSMLTDMTMNYGGLKDKIHLHPKSDRIGFAGLISGENPITYKTFERSNMIDFLKVLSASPFEYVIFDCDANAVYDSMTLLALETADVVLRTITPDVKGYEFQKAQLSWMKNGENFHVEKQIKIACPVYEVSPIKEAEALAGGFDYILPFSYEVMSKFIAGDLLENFTQISGQQYEREVKKLCERIVEEPDEK